MKSNRVMKGVTLALLGVGAILVEVLGAHPVRQQTGVSDNGSTTWISYEGVGEEFSVLVPREPFVHNKRRTVRQTRRFENEPVRVYGTFDDGVVYLIASYFNPHKYETLDYFCDTLLRHFASSLNPQAVGNASLGRIEGREFALQRNEIKGIARVFVTKDHAYLVAAVGGDRSNESVKRFNDSFTLSEKSAPHKAEEPDEKDWRTPGDIRPVGPIGPGIY